VDYTESLALRGLAHDLNNIFETLAEASELLDGDERWKALAAVIGRSVDRGRRVTASLHASGASHVDLAAVVAHAMDSSTDFVQAARLAPLRFVVLIEPGLTVYGIAGAWERVFANLFTNAARENPAGGVITVEGRRVADGVEIAVRDDGAGIPEDLLDRIFEAGVSSRESGTGLGLHIVRSIVEGFGGTVRALNRNGAVFEILARE